jgi:hypothetical protein
MGLPISVLVGVIVTLSLAARSSLALVGLFIFWRRSDDWLALVMSAMLVTVLIEGVSVENRGLALMLPGLWFLANLLFVPLPFVFPNGRFEPRWARWVVWPLAIALAASSAYAPAGGLSALLYLAYLPLAASSLIYRYTRVSTAVERQQTKWVVAGLLCSFVVAAAWQINSSLFPPSNPTPARLIALVGMGVFLYLPGYFALAASIVFAVMRYRLWDIDVIINRALVYVGLTATLAAVYLGSVVLLQGFFGAFAPLGGRESPLTVVTSTLVIAALFSPLQRRLQAAIDRRFYRRKYNAAQTLTAFGAVARDETNLDALAGRLVGVVNDTIQPAGVSLWLRPTEAAGRRESR